jgi:hypothetical protein
MPLDPTLLEQLKRAAFTAGDDENAKNYHIYDALHDVAYDAVDLLLADHPDTASDDDIEALQLAYKSGFWESTHVPERRAYRAALERLLNCPDVNEDQLSPETIAACDQALGALAQFSPPQP